MSGTRSEQRAKIVFTQLRAVPFLTVFEADRERYIAALLAVQ